MSSANSHEAIEARIHSRRDAAWFFVRTAVFRCRRFVRDLASRPSFFSRSQAGDNLEIAGSSSSSLYVREGVSPTERLWQLGKVQNLRLAIAAINGRLVPAGEVFSFWRHVGPPWAMRGFVVGRELREGCLIPNVGGGLCQLSNALYDCALKADCGIVERHPHTQVIPGSLAELDRDATVFWNYVDLRFRPAQTTRLSARLTHDRLEVAFLSEKRSQIAPSLTRRREESAVAESCATCGIVECLRHAGPGGAERESVAVIVDRFAPEFDGWLRDHDRSAWHLSVPMRHSRWRRVTYAWADIGWRSISDAPLQSLLRAWKSRKLARQGAARQRRLLDDDRAMARALSRSAPWQCSSAIVAQTLAPHLDESGWLGGRSYGVLLTRWPLRLLQQTLDALAGRHPKSPTAADFRVDGARADREWEMLEAAEFLVTCHAGLAAIWPEKTTLLPWRIPSAQPPRAPGSIVVFPASGVARKGAYELRDAMRTIDAPLRIVGTRQLENDPDFWSGVRLEESPPNDWLANAAVVVLPAWVEHEPRCLLQAIGTGVPVIATTACGLSDAHDGRVRLVRPGDVDGLVSEILHVL